MANQDPLGYVARPRYLVNSKDALGELGTSAALGQVDGVSTVNKFGENSAVGTSSIETIWDNSNNYTFPTGADITHVRAANNSAATRGLDVEVQGLDTNWAQVIQTATLDGTDSTTQVALGTALRRVFRMKVVDTGGTSADQDIWAGAVGTGSALAKAVIQSGNNQTLMAIWTVPASKTALVTHYYATLNRAAGGGSTLGMKVRLWVQDNANGYPPQLKHVRGLDSAANSSFDNFFDPNFKVTEKSDIYLQAENLSGSISGDVTGGFDLLLVDN